MRKNSLIMILLFILIVGLIYLGLRFNNEKTSIRLDDVEIREYEGKKLSSVHDFRENSIKGPQYIDINNYKLEVGGLVEKPAFFMYDDIVNKYTSYEKVVTLDCVEGWSATILWEGMLLRELLAKTEPKLEANTIIFKAYDGYSTSFPIEYIMDNDILMAYKMNGETMIPERGFPFQLVAESKWGYKWIKWITEIEFSDDEDYEGFWERRGYSDDGNLDNKFFK